MHRTRLHPTTAHTKNTQPLCPFVPGPATGPTRGLIEDYEACQMVGSIH